MWYSFIQTSSEPLASKALKRRFDDKLDKPDDEDDCWLWMGYINEKGYGSIYIRGRVVAAHRASWMIHRGPIPDGASILHRCDVRHCVNPSHLFLGTHGDNMSDMVAKGRQPLGERNGHAKLTDTDIMAIRAAPITVSHSELARQFGVSRPVISLIRRGKRWTHIPP